MSKYLDLSIIEINNKLKNKEIKPLDLVLEAFERIEENKYLNSFITLGYLVNSVDGFNIALSLAIADGNAVIVADADLLIANPTLITETLEENIEIIAWTVNNAYLAQSLKKIGVTRLISDNIKEVL
jgi:glycerophosphoryl diester phosphodiesterase